MPDIDIPDVIPWVRYTADGITSDFVFPFPIFEADDLAVYIGTTKQTPGVHYTIAGIGTTGGGTVTFVAPIPTGAGFVTLCREITPERITDFPTSGTLTSDGLNLELDRLTATDQDLAARLTRTFQQRVDEAAADLTLPSVAERANRALGFDLAGLPIAIDPGSGGGGGGGGGGVTDHGALTGLADDDHPHYLTTGRGDGRYSSLGHMHDTLYLPINAKLDDLATPDDNTDLNADVARHGLLRKLSGNAAQYLDGSGGWSVPAGGGPGAIDLDALTDVVITAPLLAGHALQWNGTNWVNAAPGTVFTFSIASFTSNQGSPQLIGQSVNVWRAAGAISFSASYNNGPATSGLVNIVAGTTAWGVPLNMGPPNYIGPRPTVTAVLYPAGPNTSIVFRLSASNGIVNVSNDVSVYFNNSVFWGTTTNALPYSAGAVTSLGNSAILSSNTRARSFTVNAANDEYIVYAYPKRLGQATFTVGGFDGGFEAAVEVSVTNAAGYTEDYYVYRSTNPSLGGTTVGVS